MASALFAVDHFPTKMKLSKKLGVKFNPSLIGNFIFVVLFMSGLLCVLFYL